MDHHLPDLPHIEQIRRRLWGGLGIGQAAVMVGSGLSRNAEPNSPKASPFPVWRDLGRALYDALHPNKKTDPAYDYIVEAAIANNGILRLAYEYETAFGDTALNQLILQTVPDDQYRPGELHRLLLTLPWSDVFTTNYDTLLERTAPAIQERKYDVVLTSSDLPGRMKPRIVKLHGSFPSYRPFILTEEHYRTYPARFAPFVNTVQQSLMENAFVLIGFSGDDPNFLQWIGWVRDRLGTSCPPVYLCGLLNLSSSRRRVLEKLGVIPVDLAPLLDESRYPDAAERHRLALKWLLLAFLQGRPADLLRWPEESSPAHWPVIEPTLPELPAPPAGIPPELVPATQSPERLGDNRLPSALVRLRERWTQVRELYPGWVVAPNEARRRITRGTDRWLQYVVSGIGALEAPEDLRLAYELNWRFERALLPLSTEYAKVITQIVERYNPAPESLDMPAALHVSGAATASGLAWGELRELWVGLAFGLARRGREDADQDYEKWMHRLKHVTSSSPHWHARWCHESCQYHVHRSELGHVRKLLEQWPAISELPFREVQRAALIAELGDTMDAERRVEDALAEIRARQTPGKPCI